MIKKEKLKKLYQASKKSRSRAYRLVLFILAGYLFFFTSNLILPQPISTPSEIGRELSYAAQRSVTIYNATYDKEQQLFEVVMAMKNETYDNVNEYYFFPSVTGRHSYGSLTAAQIFNDSLITVLRIENLKPFDELKIVFAPRLSENLEDIPSSTVGTLTFNRENLDYAKVSERTREDYLGYRFESALETAEEELSNAKAEKERLTSNLAAIEKENEELSKDMQYFTAEEKRQAEEKIKANKKTKAELALAIEKAQQEVEKQKEKYNEAYKMLHKNFEEKEEK